MDKYTKQNDENTTLADSGVTVVAAYEAVFSPSWYSAVTDSNGVYSFSNLPSTNANIITLPFNDGTYDYDISSNEVELLPGLTVTTEPIILQIATAQPFVLTNNFENDDFELTESLTITFSKTMDASSFDITLWSSEYGNVAFESSWTNNITLTIDPLVTLQANTTYSLSLSGVSQDNNSYSDDLNFETLEGIEFVWTNLERVNSVFDEFSDTSNIEIIFTMAVNLNNYNGYVTLSDEANTLVSISLSTTDSTTLIIDPLYNLEPGQDYTLEWKVYSTIEGDYDDGGQDFETMSDVTAPAQVTGFTIDMGDDWTADWNTTSTQSFIVDLSAYEYLSATEPTFGFVESGGDTSYVLPNSSVSLDWGSTMMSGTFIVVVPAGKDGSCDEFFITNLKDASENASSDTVRVTLN